MAKKNAFDRTNTSDDGYNITPSDDENIQPTRAIYVGSSGDLTVTMKASGVKLTFANVPSGTVLPIQAKRVWQTGTDAGDLIGLV